jgi:hypothetical protein
MSARINYTGRTFDRLTVAERVYGRTKYVRCVCVCGNSHVALISNLVRGLTKSCGCLNRELARVRGKKIPRRPQKFEAFVRVLRGTYITSNKRRNIPYVFELSEAECAALFTANCTYCGLPPSNKMTVYKFVYTGIDRVDASIGYTTSNSVPCCSTCNYAKQSMTRSVFLSWIARVYVHSVQANTAIQPVSTHHKAPCQRAWPSNRK